MGSRMNMSYREMHLCPSLLQPLWKSQLCGWCPESESFGYETMKHGQCRSVCLLTAAGFGVAVPLGALGFPKETKDIRCHLPWSCWDREPLLGWVQCAYTGRHHPHGEEQQDLVWWEQLSAFCFAASGVHMVIMTYWSDDSSPAFTGELLLFTELLLLFTLGLRWMLTSC